MLRKLINWLDSWDDWINPITLRELRTETRGFMVESLVLFVWFVAIVSYAIILFTPDLIQYLFHKNQAFIFSTIPAVLSVCSILLSSSVISLIKRSRCDDELLGIVPLSPQQQVHGYWAYVCIWSIFCNTIFLPLIAIGRLVEPTPYVLFLAPLGSFFLCQIMTLICLSFAARNKQEWEMTLSIFIPSFYPLLIAIFWSRVIIFPMYYRQPPTWNYEFGFVSLFILLPIMLLLHVYVSYRLSIYGFKTWRKPFWHFLLLNIAVYTLFNVTAAAIWIVIAVVVFYF
jgi:hypothetical protein